MLFRSTLLEARYGDSLWWTSMGEIAERFSVDVAADAGAMA